MRATTPPVPPWLLGTAKLPEINDYKWELYNLTDDYSQYNDLAAKNPDKLQGAAGVVPDGGGEIPGLAAGQLGPAPHCDAAAERDRRANGLHLFR